jgi:hypothetical protein
MMMRCLKRKANEHFPEKVVFVCCSALWVLVVYCNMPVDIKLDGVVVG